MKLVTHCQAQQPEPRRQGACLRSTDHLFGNPTNEPRQEPSPRRACVGHLPGTGHPIVQRPLSNPLKPSLQPLHRRKHIASHLSNYGRGAHHGGSRSGTSRFGDSTRCQATMPSRQHNRHPSHRASRIRPLVHRRNVTVDGKDTMSRAGQSKVLLVATILLQADGHP